MVKNNCEKLSLIVICLTFGIIFALSTPFGYGNDEMVHAYKANSLAAGYIFPDKLDQITIDGDTQTNAYGSPVQKSLIDLASLTWQAKAQADCSQFSCAKPQDSIENDIKRISEMKINSERLPVDFWGANNYISIPYIPSALGFSFASIFNTSIGVAFYIARITNLIACLSLVIFAFIILRGTKFRWVVAALALLPSSLLSYSLLGVDGILNALSILLLAIIARSIVKPELHNSKIISSVALSIAILLPVIKLPYIILSLLILIPGVLGFSHFKRLKYIFLPLILIIPAILWNGATADISTASSAHVFSGSSQPVPSEQILSIVNNPPTFIKTLLKSIAITGNLPSTGDLTHQFGLRLPNDLMVLSALPLLLTTLYAKRDFRNIKSIKKYGSIILIASICLYLTIFLALYVTYNSVGSPIIKGVQNRYFIPIYGFISLAIAMLTNIKISYKNQKAHLIFIGYQLASLTVISAWYVNIVH